MHVSEDIMNMPGYSWFTGWHCGFTALFARPEDIYP
jgi:hypothetical protein